MVYIKDALGRNSARGLAYVLYRLDLIHFNTLMDLYDILRARHFYGP